MGTNNGDAPLPGGAYAPEIVIKDGLVVSRGLVRRADVAVQDGKVRAVGVGLPIGEARVIVAAGRYVLPGVIDAHVHPILAETIGSVSVGGLHGGVLTQIHFIYDEPDIGLVATNRRYLEEGLRTSATDFTFHARIIAPAAELEEIPALAAMGINSFKLFLAFKQKGEMIPDNHLVHLFRQIAAVGGVALIHAENGEIIDALEQEMIAAGRDDGRAFAESRPPLAETEAIYRVLTIGALTNCPVYIVHMSVAEGLEIVRRARERGQTVYAETCPQYLTVTEEIHDELGVLAKIAPPLRTAMDLAAFWEGIRDGTVDVVGSDHNGSDRDYKYKPSGSIWDAGFGAPMIETMLPIMYHAGVVAERITMPQLVRVLAERPAEVFGLADRKGSITPGLDADLLIWDQHGSQTIRAADFHSNAFYTFYEGREVQGRLALAMQRGRILLDEDGTCHARAGDGRFLARHAHVVPTASPTVST